jgi:hypothetical protein
MKRMKDYDGRQASMSRGNFKIPGFFTQPVIAGTLSVRSLSVGNLQGSAQLR